MAINKKLITFNSKTVFEGQYGINKASSPTNGYYNNIPEYSIVFIKDTGEIWHKGKYFGMPLSGQISKGSTNSTSGIVYTTDGSKYYYKNASLWGNTFNGGDPVYGDLFVGNGSGTVYASNGIYSHSSSGKSSSAHMVFGASQAVSIPNGNLTVGNVNTVVIGNAGTIVASSTIKGSQILNTKTFFDATTAQNLGKTWLDIRQYDSKGPINAQDANGVITIKNNTYTGDWIPWIAGADATAKSSWAIGLGGDAFYIGRVSNTQTTNALTQYWKFGLDSNSKPQIYVDGTKVSLETHNHDGVYLKKGDAATSNHTHGNITNDGKKISYTEANDSTKYLRADGAWVTPSNTNTQYNFAKLQYKTSASANAADFYLPGVVSTSNATNKTIIAGDGISFTVNGNELTIANSKPDVNHNTDNTGVKLVSSAAGAKKTDGGVVSVASSTGLQLAGGTNCFTIGNGTNYIEVPITLSYTNSRDAGYGKVSVRKSTDTKTETSSATASTYSETLQIIQGANLSITAANSGTANSDTLTFAVTDVMTTSHAANGITSTNISNWNAVHTWYSTAAGTDTKGVIDNWNEIKNFVASFKETDDLATYLANTYLAKSGGTMSGNISFASVETWPAATNQTYPASSVGLTWSGESDNAYIKYRLNNSNNGALVLGVNDDGDETIDIDFANTAKIRINPNSTNIYPTTTNTGSLGTSTYKWRNVYATTFNGDLLGTASGNLTGISYASSSRKLQQTKNGSTTDVVTFGTAAFSATTDFAAASAGVGSVIEITKSLTPTTSWADTGITSNSTTFPGGNGSYLIQVSVPSSSGTDGWGELYTGYFSLFSDTNSSIEDEIFLHCATHASHKRIYIKTRATANTDGTMHFWIASETNFAAARNITFKFRKLI